MSKKRINHRTDLFHLLHSAAHGGEVTPDELAKIPLPPGKSRPEFDRVIRSEVSKISRLHREGCFGDARDIADEVADQYLTSWGDDGPPSQADALRAARVDAAFSEGPDAMARLVPRNPF